MDKSERGDKFRTVSIEDDKINDNDNGINNPTEFSCGNKARDNTEVWVSKARMVDDYEGCTPVVDRLSRTIVDYCRYSYEKNGTGNNHTK